MSEEIKFSDQIKDIASKFSTLAGIDDPWAFAADKIKESVNELRELNSIMNEISKTAGSLSSYDLKILASDSFAQASEFGKKASDYLDAVKEMSNAGYSNLEGMSSLSLMAQSAGDITAEMANNYIIATDKAYKMGGSIKELTSALDGANAIADNNSIRMDHIAEGMSLVGAKAADSNLKISETTAALSTMITVTRQSGSEMADSFQGILMNLQQLTSEDKNITPDSLAKYEQACNDLGVSLRETKNGIVSLRDPMDILKELSEAYSKLDGADGKRANLLRAAGGESNADGLNAILENWDMYEKMLKEYTDGTDSLYTGAIESANDWEGSLNRLGNTWTDTVSNVADSSAITGVINTLNNLLSVVNTITSSLGSLGTIVVGLGAAFSIKNFGWLAFIG